MRLLIFSDTHLTNEFDEKKFKFLKKIVEESDQVIINGDFWEGYVMSFSDFVNSEWSGLFSLLKKKKATYLFGNHDRENFCDKRVSFFSTSQGENLFIKTKKHELVIEHGNQYLHFIDEKLPGKKIPAEVVESYLKLERFMVREFGKVLIGMLYKKYNESIKNKLKMDLKENQVLVCGHTHLAEVDVEGKFINSGIISYALGQYLVLENEIIKEFEHWYDEPIVSAYLFPELYENYFKKIMLSKST